MVTLEASAALVGPVLAAASVTPLAASRATTVPSEVHTTLTVIEVPEAADGVNAHPVAVPVLEKSPEAMPLTDSLNASVYDNVRLVDGLDGGVHVAVGAMLSLES